MTVPSKTAATEYKRTANAEDGTVAHLLEDLVAGVDDPEAHAVVGSVVSASLIVHKGEVQPGLLLDDGTVVVLGVRQLVLLRECFSKWQDVFVGTKLGASSPTSRKVAV